MPESHEDKPKSLLIFLYDKKLQVKFYYALPLSTAAPAINRIVKETVQENMKTAGEPWYQLIPHCVHQNIEFQRAPIPEGETSVRGERYFPDQEPPPRVFQHPKPHQLFFTVIIRNYQEEIFRGQFSVDDFSHRRRVSGAPTDREG